MKLDPAEQRLTFGQAVRRRRLRLKLSQEQLAALAGLHRTYVGGVERGERNVSLVNIHALAHALRVSPAELLREADQHHQKVDRS